MKVNMLVEAKTYARLCEALKTDSALRVSATEAWPHRYKTSEEYADVVRVIRGRVSKLGDPEFLEIELEISEEVYWRDVFDGDQYRATSSTDCQSVLTPREKIDALFDILGVFPRTPPK